MGQNLTDNVYVTRDQWICATFQYNMYPYLAHRSMDTMDNDPV